MTTDNRTIPLHWSDELIELSYSLKAYHCLQLSFIEKFAREYSNGDARDVVVGSETLFRPILETLDGFIAEMDGLRAVYRSVSASEDPCGD